VLAAGVMILSATFGFAECPVPPDVSAELAPLFEEARAAANDMAGREVSNLMWQIWMRAPDEPAQELLDQGLRQREVYDFLGARETFDRLVTYCPLYAEGFNQRAFISFLTEDYEAALADLDIAQRLNPEHVGVLSGRALTLMNLGRLVEARAQLEAALVYNPWLSERFLLMPNGPLAPQGKDL
jgi:tetratricopeptide (TPR) repeat protein